MRPWLVLLPLAVGCSLVLLWLSAAPSTSLSPANRSRGPPFDPGRDTFVLLHIQKTGGTAFASALLFLNVSAEFGCVHWNGSTARNWLIANPNEALKPGAFSCARQPGTRQPTDWNHPESLAAVQAQWLFSRPTTGWPCGAHTDLAHLLVCFDRWLVARANKNSTIPLGVRTSMGSLFLLALCCLCSDSCKTLLQVQLHWSKFCVSSPGQCRFHGFLSLQLDACT
eukprot:m.250490 g.250490  ORF g.250490 m.250490 type:complete len:225 (-) comp54507_c0_seq19:834-1508(-)